MLQHTATHCNTLQLTATRRRLWEWDFEYLEGWGFQKMAICYGIEPYKDRALFQKRPDHIRSQQLFSS